jgi:hypothetical protein
MEIEIENNSIASRSTMALIILGMASLTEIEAALGIRRGRGIDNAAKMPKGGTRDRRGRPQRAKDNDKVLDLDLDLSSVDG